MESMNEQTKTNNTSLQKTNQKHHGAWIISPGRPPETTRDRTTARLAYSQAKTTSTSTSALEYNGSRVSPFLASAPLFCLLKPAVSSPPQIFLFRCVPARQPTGHSLERTANFTEVRYDEKKLIDAPFLSFPFRSQDHFLRK